MVVFAPERKRKRKKKQRAELLKRHPLCDKCGTRILPIRNGSGTGCCCTPSEYYRFSVRRSSTRSSRRSVIGYRRSGPPKTCRGCTGNINGPAPPQFLAEVAGIADYTSSYKPNGPPSGPVFCQIQNFYSGGSSVPGACDGLNAAYICDFVGENATGSGIPSYSIINNRCVYRIDAYAPDQGPCYALRCVVAVGYNSLPNPDEFGAVCDLIGHVTPGGGGAWQLRADKFGLLNSTCFDSTSLDPQTMSSPPSAWCDLRAMACLVSPLW